MADERDLRREDTTLDGHTVRPAPPAAKDDRTLGQLFSDLTSDFSLLLRQEFTLAKTEMSEKAGELAKSVAMLAVGGFIAYAGFLALLTAAIIGLAFVVPWWLSALIVGLVVVIIGYVLVQSGINGLKQANLAPERTTESVKRDAEVVKEHTRV